MHNYLNCPSRQLPDLEPMFRPILSFWFDIFIHVITRLKLNMNPYVPEYVFFAQWIPISKSTVAAVYGLVNPWKIALQRNASYEGLLKTNSAILLRPSPCCQIMPFNINTVIIYRVFATFLMSTQTTLKFLRRETTSPYHEGDHRTIPTSFLNIHLPAILMFTRGIGFWPIAITVAAMKNPSEYTISSWRLFFGTENSLPFIS